MGWLQYVKLLLKGKTVLGEVVAQEQKVKEAYQKSSWKSTEFWTSVVVAVASIAAQLVGVLPAPWGGVAASASSAMYAVSRGWAKYAADEGGEKTGYKTTEFWVNLLAQLGTVSLAVSKGMDPQTASMLVVASNSAYALSRGLAKGATPEENPGGPTA